MTDQYPFIIRWVRTKDWWINDWRVMSTWCEDTFGQDGWQWQDTSFCFKTQKDANWFTLRWGNARI